MGKYYCILDSQPFVHISHIFDRLPPRIQDLTVEFKHIRDPPSGNLRWFNLVDLEQFDTILANHSSLKQFCFILTYSSLEEGHRDAYAREIAELKSSLPRTVAKLRWSSHLVRRSPFPADYFTDK